MLSSREPSSPSVRCKQGLLFFILLIICDILKPISIITIIIRYLLLLNPPRWCDIGVCRACLYWSVPEGVLQSAMLPSVQAVVSVLPPPHRACVVSLHRHARVVVVVVVVEI